MSVGRVVHRPITKDTVQYARDAIRRLHDRRRDVVRDIDAEIHRLEKMITDAGLDP
jgi:hypothetical protein